MNFIIKKQIIISFLILFTPISFAKMLILNANECNANICTQTQNFTDKKIQSFNIQNRIKKNDQKNVTKEAYDIVLNDQRVSVEILDKESPDGFVALLNQKGTSLYAIHATSGSAGRYYHYFNIQDDKTYYLGFFPELTSVDNKEHEFISYERDGSRSIASHWRLDKDKLISLSQEITP